MKIIISHDIDHLYSSDHFFKDLILPKLWVRSFIHLVQGKISVNTFISRLALIVDMKMNMIEELVEFELEMGIPSTFFFGMANGLGLSYSKSKAKYWMDTVNKSGLDIGIHGISYTDIQSMEKEYNDFKDLSNLSSFGIRTHYVRYDSDTFNILNRLGYLYDTSWFDKTGEDLKPPYKVGKMWEFPLHIMDGYIQKPGKPEYGKTNTIEAITRAKELKLPYCTILFHDYLFNPKRYPQECEWYKWLIAYLKDNGYEFISYEDAIAELEYTE